MTSCSINYLRGKKENINMGKAGVCRLIQTMFAGTLTEQGSKLMINHHPMKCH